MTEPMGDVPQVSAAIAFSLGAVAPPQEPDQPEQEEQGDE